MKLSALAFLTASLLFALLCQSCATSPTAPGQPPLGVLWQQDFKTLSAEQQKSWKALGASSFTAEGIVTISTPAQDHSIVSTPVLLKSIPDGFDGTVLRASWTFIPNKIGGWGSDFRINSAMVVELTGPTPTLNAKIQAKSRLVAGAPCTMTCDFSQYLITSWTINGVEQLDKPIPVWNNGSGEVRINLADFKDTNSQTTWLNAKLETLPYSNKKLLQVAGWQSFPRLSPDTRPDFLLGQADPMQKVFREAQAYTGGFNRNVKISCAGRERESFQLVVFPLDRKLEDVAVTVTDLQNMDGAKDFPASRIQIHPVGYVRTVKGYRSGWQWPDVLMPQKPFDVEPGFVQPVWFTVDVPEGTAPGDYHGFIHVTAKNMEPQMATLSLTVLPYSLPLRGKLKTAFCICPGMWEIWYEPDQVKQLLGMSDKTGHGPLYTSNEAASVLPRQKWLEMYDFLLAHRISPTVIYSGLKNGKARVIPALEDMQYCYDRGMNATCLLCIGGAPTDKAQADKYLNELDAWLKPWEKFAREKNWKDFTWYLHSYDETEMQPAKKEYFDYCINKTHSFVGERHPWIKRETANPYIERHKGNFDIWTPVTSQITSKMLPTYRQAQADGQEVWAYVCCGPGKPFANFLLDFDGVDPRILPWQFYQYKLTGFLYYLMNHYQPQTNWNMNAPKWPDLPWNVLSYNTNSDGILFYPGPDATPLASTRMENLRDGIEDYEALAILQELSDKFKAETEEDKQFQQDIQTLLAVPQELSKSWTEYTKNPAVIHETRAKVDAAIIKMLQK